MDAQDIIKVEDAAKLSGYCPAHLRRLSREGLVPGARRVRRPWLYDPIALKEWALGQPRKPGPHGVKKTEVKKTPPMNLLGLPADIK